jgi:hypothetical protein
MYLAASTEVTLLLNMENLCTSSCLLFKSYFQHFISFHSIFFLFKANIMLMCCSLTSAIFLVCHNEQEITQQTHMQQTYSKLEMTQQTLLYVHPGVKYRVIRNDCRDFNLSYTIHLTQEYVVALMDQEISSVDVCRITKGAHTERAPLRYVTKTWGVVLLNKKTHILLSQVYCV